MADKVISCVGLSRVLMKNSVNWVYKPSVFAVYTQSWHSSLLWKEIRHAATPVDMLGIDNAIHQGISLAASLGIPYFGPKLHSATIHCLHYTPVTDKQVAYISSHCDVDTLAVLAEYMLLSSAKGGS